MLGTSNEKISYWVNNSGLNYEMNFVCYAGEDCQRALNWLEKKLSNNS